MISQRLARAEFELGFAKEFDRVVVNDDLGKAEKEVLEIVSAFVSKG